MSKTEKTLRRIMAGTADANIPFDDLCHVLRDLGFTKRVRGSHHIFARRDVEEIVKLQPRRGKAKAVSGAADTRVDRALPTRR